jgi:hypothetical protein
VLDNGKRTPPHGDPLTNPRKIEELLAGVDVGKPFWTTSWEGHEEVDIAADLRSFASMLKSHPLASSHQRKIADRMMADIAETLGVDLDE